MDASASAGRRLTATSITSCRKSQRTVVSPRGCAPRRGRVCGHPGRAGGGGGAAAAPEEGGGPPPRRIEAWRQPGSLRSLEPVDVDSEAALQRDVAAENVDARLRGEKE